MPDLLSTPEIIGRLRFEGFSLTSGYLQYCLREHLLERPMQIGRTLCWTEADIEALRQVLLAHGRLRQEEIAK